MAELLKDPTCKVKVNVFTNRDGNILQPGETVAGQKILLSVELQAQLLLMN